MDNEVLVDQQIEDGLALITKLVGDGFDVTVAFWAKMSDGGLWYLYIGTRSLESMSFADAWRALFASLNQVHPCSISISEIKLISSTDPISIAAIDAGHARQYYLPTRYLKASLGNLAVEDVYIYPKSTETMNRSLVLQQVANLMTRTGDLAASLVILRDGMRMYAVPIGMQMTATGGVDVVWRDVDADVDRTISADEVASIQKGRRTPDLMKLIR